MLFQNFKHFYTCVLTFLSLSVCLKLNYVTLDNAAIFSHKSMCNRFQRTVTVCLVCNGISEVSVLLQAGNSQIISSFLLTERGSHHSSSPSPLVSTQFHVLYIMLR